MVRWRTCSAVFACCLESCQHKLYGILDPDCGLYVMHDTIRKVTTDPSCNVTTVHPKDLKIVLNDVELSLVGQQIVALGDKLLRVFTFMNVSLFRKDITYSVDVISNEVLHVILDTLATLWNL